VFIPGTISIAVGRVRAIRVISRMAVAKKKTTRLNPFYGIPAKQIAEWCGVSIGTAEHYKAGRRKPPTPALKLFRLNRDQKVLSDEHWKGFRVVDDKIFPSKGRPFTTAHLYLWELLWHALAEATTKKYHELLKKAANS